MNYIQSIIVEDTTYSSAKAFGKTLKIATHKFYKAGICYSIKQILNPEIIAKEDLYQVMQANNAYLFNRKYAQTVHKSQGSTYDTVYIDLDDFNLCKDNLLKLLYVAVSRASNKIVFTGELRL